MDVVEGSKAPRLSLPQQLIQARAVVQLPPGLLAGKTVPLEIMIQERLEVFALPVEQGNQIDDLKQIFADRAAFGVSHVGSASQLDAAPVGQFIIVDDTNPRLIEAALATGVPVIAPALTPTEVLAAWRLGVSAVLVTPAQAMSQYYPSALFDLLPQVDVLAGGGLDEDTAGVWVACGATGVVYAHEITGDAFAGGSLDELRQRCRPLADAVVRSSW